MKHFLDLVAFDKAGDGAGGGAAGAGAGGGDGAGGGAAGAGVGAGSAGLVDAAKNAASGAGDGQQNAGDGQQQQAGSYFPTDMPEQFRGTNERETIDKLFGEINGRPKPPEKPEGYTLELPKDLQARYGDLKNDPVLPLWQKVAHKLNLSNEQYQSAFVDLYGEMTKANLIDPPIDTEVEFGALEPTTGDAAQRRAVAVQRVNAVVNWTNGLVARKELTQHEQVTLSGMAATADGVKLLEKLMRKSGEHGLQNGGAPAAATTVDALGAQMADPRYDSMSPKFDPGFRTRVDEEWRRLHGAS